MDDAPHGPDLIALTADIVGAFVANNSLRNEELAGLIAKTHGALSGLGRVREPEPLEEETFRPAVSVRKSLASRDHIVSMIDGKPYKALKRHLSRHGLTPAEYRARYKLPKDYPMVAPAYSEARRALALKLGLRQKMQAGRRKAPAPRHKPGPKARRTPGRARATS